MCSSIVGQYPTRLMPAIVLYAFKSDVAGGARFQTTNNEQVNNTTAENGGSFTNFIDVDANVGFQIVEFNNLHSAPNSIPGNVVVKTVS